MGGWRERGGHKCLSIGLPSGHAFPLQVVKPFPSGELRSHLSETEGGFGSQ